MNSDSFLDMIEILAGAYLIFLAYKMKKTGELTDNGLISKGLDLNKAPDPQGYINRMFPTSIVMGLFLAACGVASRACANLDIYSTVVTVTTVLSALAVIVFAVISTKCQNKFLKPGNK